MGEKKIVPERRKGPGWRKYAGYGVTAFFVVAASVVLIFMFVRFEEFGSIMQSIGAALAPVIYGIILAYVMNPLLNFFERRLKNLFFKKAKKVSTAKKVVRVISIILTLFCLFLGVGIIVYMLVPELTKTINMLVEKFPDQYDKFMQWFNELFLSETKAGEFFKNTFKQIYEYIDDFIKNGLSMDDTAGAVGGILASVGKGVMNVMEVLYNVALGLIFAVYFLASKEKFAAQIKKMLYAFTKRRKANTIIRVAKECHLKFSGSITGKIVDSAIIGIICFIGMVIMDMDYKPLISVIIGVTNVIPFFGPFIGAIPCAFLLLIVNPVHCLYFIIFIVILQQFDSNLLTPKIVGESIGLSPFWVLFACAVFGSLFGLFGLLLGVPSMACIYMIVKEWIENRLRHKGLHVETEEYATLDYVDEHEMVLIERFNEPEAISEDEYERQMAEDELSQKGEANESDGESGK